MSELTTIERLLLPLVRRFVSLWVRPAVLPNDVRERFAPGRPVVYVLEKRGVVDAAVLEFVCRDRGLPPPLAPLGSGALLPVSVLFLERRRGLFGQRIDRRMPEGLSALTGIAAADIAFDADLVPVSLFWGRAPDAIPFGGGALWVQPPFARTPVRDSGGSGGGADCSGAYSFHFSRSYMLAVALQAGDTLYAQYWSRDPGFAPPDNVALSNALQFTICP